MAVSPVSQAPPDRPTTNLEQWATTGLALLLGDRVLDDNERQILRGFMEQLSIAVNQGGGIGNGRPAPGGAAGAAPMSPMEMNQNTEDMGTVEGAVSEDNGGY
jgi:hypothetical protein